MLSGKKYVAPTHFPLDSPDKFDHTIGSINDPEESPEKLALNNLRQSNNLQNAAATVFNENTLKGQTMQTQL
jgi:hypothetical protein